MLSLSLLDILVCPNCQQKLSYYKTTNELICNSEQLAYPIEKDIPILLPAQARKL